MNELMISGRRHISSQRAAKDHGYHSDYIGQLIRGGKVKGQKVGRAWYVDAESLAIYLGKSIEEAQAAHAAEVAAAEATSKVVDIEIAAEEVAEEDEIETKTSDTEKEAEALVVQEKVVEEIVPVAVGEVPQENISAEAEEDSPTEGKETRVPIAIVSEKPKAEAVSVPVKKNAGLTYLADDEPLLPVLRKNKDVSKELSSSPESRGPEATPSPLKVSHRSTLRQGVALFMLGLMVLGGVTVLSSFLTFTISAGSVQSASVQFSLPQ